MKKYLVLLIALMFAGCATVQRGEFTDLQAQVNAMQSILIEEKMDELITEAEKTAADQKLTALTDRNQAPIAAGKLYYVEESTSYRIDIEDFYAYLAAHTGTLRGAIAPIITTDGSEEPTAAQMYGTVFIADHGTATSDTDYTLPTAAAGMSACFYDNGAGTGGIIIDAAASDEILLYGTGVGVADAIDSPGVAGDGANGDFICIYAIDATYWITLGSSGTWVDGGAN